MIWVLGPLGLNLGLGFGRRLAKAALAARPEIQTGSGSGLNLCSFCNASLCGGVPVLMTGTANDETVVLHV